ncbi:MAG: hypothetical protein KJO84_05475 [Acidimicrobiia bacterium]|nr:hypothetical protein [Acidimicrobiia bacterium]NNC75893.1 hypothetical protein [Acidimicrobiia bacterium]
MTSNELPVFTSTDDAELFLVERLKLWAVWVIALALLVSLTGWWLLGAAILVLVNLGALARPLHARAERLVPDDEQVGGAIQTMFGRGTRRDRLARTIMYGAGPLGEALEMTGRSRLWLAVHWGAVGLTVAAFVLVFIGGWLA